MTGDRICYLFPGQGAYLEEVFLELAGTRAQVERTFAEMDSALAKLGAAPTASVLLDGSPPRLDQLAAEDPDTLQLALFGTAVAVYRILEAEGVAPGIMMGHSLGEIAALVTAGAFPIATGAEIVRARSLSLRAAAGSGGMLAVRTGARRARALVELLDAEGLAVGVENGTEQSVLSGPDEALARAETIAREAGIRGTRLASPYPFHSPLLSPIVEDFRGRLNSAGLERHPLRRAVYSPILGRFYTDDDDLIELLAGHLVHPVRFDTALRHLYDTGTRVFVECGARSALSGVASKVLPGATALPTVLRGRAPTDSLRAVVDAASAAVHR